MRPLFTIMVGMLLSVCVSRRVLAQDSWYKEPRPPSGIGAMVVGYGAIGVGAFNLATLPICYADFYPSQARGFCIGLNAVVGAGGIALGIPLVIIGHRRRARYKDWRKSRTQQLVEAMDFSVVPEGAMVGFHKSF